MRTAIWHPPPMSVTWLFGKTVSRAFPRLLLIRECKSASLSPVGQRRAFRLSGVLNHADQVPFATSIASPLSPCCIWLSLFTCAAPAAGIILPIGVPVLNRVNFSEKQSTGMFVSTLPFIGRIDESWTLKQFNEELSDAWYDLLRHQKLSLSEINSAAKRLHPDMAQAFRHRAFLSEQPHLQKPRCLRHIFRTPGITAVIRRSLFSFTSPAWTRTSDTLSTMTI